MRKIAVILGTVAFAQLNHAQASASAVRVLLLTPFVDYAFFEPAKRACRTLLMPWM